MNENLEFHLTNSFQINNGKIQIIKYHYYSALRLIGFRILRFPKKFNHSTCFIYINENKIEISESSEMIKTFFSYLQKTNIFFTDNNLKDNVLNKLYEESPLKINNITLSSYFENLICLSDNQLKDLIKYQNCEL